MHSVLQARTRVAFPQTGGLGLLLTGSIGVGKTHLGNRNPLAPVFEAEVMDPGAC